MHFFWIFNYKKGVCNVTVPLTALESLWLFRCSKKIYTWSLRVHYGVHKMYVGICLWMFVVFVMC